MPDQQTIRFMGKTYPLVSVTDFTVDENLVLWHWAQIGPDQIPELAGVHVGVLAAIIEVSVAREDPRIQTRQLRQEIGKLKQTDLEEVLADLLGDDDTVETPTSAPTVSAPNDENTTSSGEDSSPTGASLRAVTEANGSGSGGSDGSSTSDLATSAG